MTASSPCLSFYTSKMDRIIALNSQWMAWKLTAMVFLIVKSYKKVCAAYYVMNLRTSLPNHVYLRLSSQRVGSALPAQTTGESGRVRGSVQAILFSHQGCLSSKWVLTGLEFHGHSYTDKQCVLAWHFLCVFNRNKWSQCFYLTSVTKFKLSIYFWIFNLFFL